MKRKKQSSETDASAAGIDPQARIDLAAELLARIAVRIASERQCDPDRKDVVKDTA